MVTTGVKYGLGQLTESTGSNTVLHDLIKRSELWSCKIREHDCVVYPYKTSGPGCSKSG